MGTAILSGAPPHSAAALRAAPRFRLTVSLACLGLLAAVGSAAVLPPAQIQVTWLGQACFLIVSPGGTQILIDPFIKGNPSTPDSLQDLSRYHPNYILVTHSHGDHSKDAKEIALASGASVVADYDWLRSVGLPDNQMIGGNVGGTIKAGDVVIHIVPAMHGST